MLLIAMMMAMTMAFTVTGAAQVDGQVPNANCFLETNDQFEGYFCINESEVDALLCPMTEKAEEGDLLDCTNGQEEPFDCLVLEVFEQEVFEQEVFEQEVFDINAFCTPAEDPPDPDPGQQQPNQKQPNQQQPNQQQGVPAPITQEGEQESEAGEVDQNFDVS